MKLFWFFCSEGALWLVFAALEEQTAWQLLAEGTYSENDSKKGVSVEEVHELYELAAITEIDGRQEGQVASIFPHEVNFYIKIAPGSEHISMAMNH